MLPPLTSSRHFLLPYFGTFPLSLPIWPSSVLSSAVIIIVHCLCHLCPSWAQSAPPFANPNPLPGPCHLPSPPSSASLAPFCQFHYHQIPYICDPSGLLSRTEAELIDRRLHGILSPFAASPLSSSPLALPFLHPLNVTGCFCDASSVPAPFRRQCFVHPAWRDKKMGQIRIAVLITAQGSISSIRKCAKLTSDKRRHKRNGETVAKQTHTREAFSQGFSYATSLFVRGTLKRLLSSENARERCDPDLLIVYILGWSGSSVPMPFAARLFRRNLAHLAHKSQMERVDSAEGSVFDVISDQLVRAVQLISSTSSQPLPRATTTSPPPVAATLAEFVPLSANPRTEQIPLWAILCSMALLILALVAVMLAHWIGRRISASHQKKGANRMAKGAEMIRRAQEVGAVQKQKASSAAGLSVTFATTSTAGERGGTERGGGGHQMKGSMMFRQFSRRHQRTRTDGGLAPQQKI